MRRPPQFDPSKFPGQDPPHWQTFPLREILPQCQPFPHVISSSDPSFLTTVSPLGGKLRFLPYTSFPPPWPQMDRSSSPSPPAQRLASIFDRTRPSCVLVPFQSFHPLESMAVLGRRLGVKWRCGFSPRTTPENSKPWDPYNPCSF